MIRNILFDLDDTLLDFLMQEKAALSRTLTEAGIDPTPAAIARYSAINSWHWEQLEKGLLTREEVKLNRFVAFFQEMGFSGAAQAAKRYETLLGVGHYWMPGAKELLDALQADGRYRLYLASNGTASVQQGRLASAGMEHYFDGIFISEEMGADKPSLEYFDLCFARIPDFKREETVMVGDRLTSDILGGLRAGIRTIWFNPYGAAPRADIRPDHTITALADLPALLAEL